MKTNNQIFKKVEELASVAKKDFRSKGIAIPTKAADGSVKFDNYTVIKNKQGFYTILNASKDPIFDYINLAQTAIILANTLAIRKWADDSIINYDRQYGYNTFEEEQYKRVAQSSAKKKDWERVDTMMIKQNIAHLKAEAAKNHILSSFEKFSRLR